MRESRFTRHPAGVLLLALAAGCMAPTRGEACDAVRIAVGSPSESVVVDCFPSEDSFSPFTTEVLDFESPVYSGNGADAVTVFGGVIEAGGDSDFFGDSSQGLGASDDILMLGGDDVFDLVDGRIGSPGSIVDVDLGDGDDQFTAGGLVEDEGGSFVPDAILNGGVRGGAGDDAFTVDVGAGILLGLDGEDGNDVFDIRGGAIGGNVSGGSGADTVGISGGAIGGGVSGDDGNDRITLSGGSVASGISGGIGNDAILVSGGSLGGGVSGGAGVDTVGISGGSVAGGIEAESVTLTGGAVSGDVSGLATLFINDPASASPLELRDGVVFSGTNAVATIIDTDLAAGGTRTQVFRGFDVVTVDPSTIGFGSGTVGIGLLNLVDGSTLFVNGIANMTGTANVIRSTIDMLDSAADDIFTLGGIRLENARLLIDVNQQTLAADRISAGGLTVVGSNVVLVNLLGAPSFSGQVDIPVIISTTGIPAGAFSVQGIPGTPGSLFTYELLAGPSGGLLLRILPADFGIAAVQQAAANSGIVGTALDALDIIVDDAIATDLGLAVGSQGVQISPTLSVFASGQFAHTEHDGFDVSGNGFTGAGPSFDVDEFSAAISVDFNAAKHFAFDQQYGLNLGLFAGYASADVGFGAFRGFDTIGDATNRSGMFGGYGLFRSGFDYLLVAATAFLGGTDVFNGVLGTTGSYDTEGYGLTASVGHIFVLDERMRFDLRGGLLGVVFDGDDYVDSGGTRFGASRISFGAIKFEPGIYADYALGNGMTISPYARLDLQQRLGYTNYAEIGGRRVDFDDADFSAAAMAGFNLKLSETATMSAEVRGKLSSDSSTLAGKLGVKIAF